MFQDPYYFEDALAQSRYYYYVSKNVYYSNSSMKQLHAV